MITVVIFADIRPVPVERCAICGFGKRRRSDLRYCAFLATGKNGKRENTADNEDDCYQNGTDHFASCPQHSFARAYRAFAVLARFLPRGLRFNSRIWLRHTRMRGH